MSYPDRPTFLSPDPGSLWLHIRDDSGDWVCSTTGAGFVIALNRLLRSRLTSARTPLISWDGQPVTADMLGAADAPVWSAGTQRALWAILHGASNVPAASLAAVQAEAPAPGIRSLGFGASLLIGGGVLHAPNGSPLRNPSVRAQLSTIMPQIGQALPMSDGATSPVLTPVHDLDAATAAGTQLQSTVTPTSNPGQVPGGSTQPIVPLAADDAIVPLSPTSDAQSKGNPGNKGMSDASGLSVGKVPPKVLRTNTGMQIAVPPPSAAVQANEVRVDPTDCDTNVSQSAWGSFGLSSMPSNTTIAIVAAGLLTIGVVLYIATGHSTPPPPAQSTGPRPAPAPSSSSAPSTPARANPRKGPRKPKSNKRRKSRSRRSR